MLKLNQTQLALYLALFLSTPSSAFCSEAAFCKSLFESGSQPSSDASVDWLRKPSPEREMDQ